MPAYGVCSGASARTAVGPASRGREAAVSGVRVRCGVSGLKARTAAGAVPAGPQAGRQMALDVRPKSMWRREVSRRRAATSNGRAVMATPCGSLVFLPDC
ncbi:hypothetical protein GCM10019016_024090 [Streptomyces prasinosporus]|uniref:Uncharacterized protein n=1 Tax=Streptomyces prasinosporus TaxID=68256 RepID=A0ABP6TKI2_9ACTN